MNSRRSSIIDVLIGVMTIAMIVLGVAFYKNFNGVLPESPKGGIEATNEPQKTDFGTVLPTDFPNDIPTEKGARVEQSHGLNYAGQKQLTIVFLSEETVAENYSLYTDYLQKQSWSVSNKYESTKLSSLYGTKGNNDINVTISENTSAVSAKSQVSISILKK